MHVDHLFKLDSDDQIHGAAIMAQHGLDLDAHENLSNRWSQQWSSNSSKSEPTGRVLYHCECGYHRTWNKSKARHTPLPFTRSSFCPPLPTRCVHDSRPHPLLRTPQARRSTTPAPALVPRFDTPSPPHPGRLHLSTPRPAQRSTPTLAARLAQSNQNARPRAYSPSKCARSGPPRPRRRSAARYGVHDTGTRAPPDKKNPPSRVAIDRRSTPSLTPARAREIECYATTTGKANSKSTPASTAPPHSTYTPLLSHPRPHPSSTAPRKCKTHAQTLILNAPPIQFHPKEGHVGEEARPEAAEGGG
ncbi:hypothetical protein B0H16DRAFT_1720327 [Mycena metata]|uniref:Uncharacterized protein n=1 Tax=Mycena metata TaxID=1033252 RepID=A0AAD7JCN3_9AGAR|nr:hypothetical protein B0H16DRAFT_1720327 [Mycena metata]